MFFILNIRVPLYFRADAMKTILIVEDDNDVSRLLRIILSKEGYKTEIYKNGNDFFDQIDRHKPDLVILDLLLPQMSGFEICKQLKEDDEYRKIPVIALTSRSDKFDIINGLNIGFDHYFTKPFDNKILVAKINAILRREGYSKEPPKPSKIQIDENLIIDKDMYAIIINGEDVRLSSLEFKTFCILAENKNKVICRNIILDSISSFDTEASDRSIDKIISRMRKKLGDYSHNLVAVYGVGYCFRINEEKPSLYE